MVVLFYIEIKMKIFPYQKKRKFIDFILINLTVLTILLTTTLPDNIKLWVFFKDNFHILRSFETKEKRSVRI